MKFTRLELRTTIAIGATAMLLLTAMIVAAKTWPGNERPSSSKSKVQSSHSQSHSYASSIRPQDFGGGFGPTRQRGSVRSDYPQWSIDSNFKHDVFTFARIQFDSYGGGGRGGGYWRNDYPDCDWNFSWRLQELTSLQVDPDGIVLRLTDDELSNYPFIYMSNVQRMALDQSEVECLRRYLNNGGFLMADDFWTPAAWRHVKAEMKRVLPDVEPRELTIDHPIFHIVYDLKEIPRIPSIRAWERGDTFEYWHGDPEGDEDPHFQGYFDNDGRLVAIFCHNNDVGDGFEREGENREYFERYSVNVSYPLGINIVIYALTH